VIGIGSETPRLLFAGMLTVRCGVSLPYAVLVPYRNQWVTSPPELVWTRELSVTPDVVTFDGVSGMPIAQPEMVAAATRAETTSGRMSPSYPVSPVRSS